MTEWDTEALIEADKRFVWHPFTNMPEWCSPGHEPLVLVEGKGTMCAWGRARAASTLMAIRRSGRTFTATRIRTSMRQSAGSSTAWRTLLFLGLPIPPRSSLHMRLSSFSRRTP